MTNTRIELYTKIHDIANSLNAEKHSVFFGDSQIVASDDDDIIKFVSKMGNEKQLFKIEDNLGNSFDNNIIVKFDKKSFMINNPYLIQMNQNAPEEVYITIQNDNYEFKFSADTHMNKSNLNKNIILTVCSSIQKHQKRVLNRIEPSQTIPVGLYAIEKEEEFIGEIMDITTLGIGLNFDEGFFDMDFFNELKNTENAKIPIAIAVDEHIDPSGYLGVVIAARHVEKHDGKIIIGADFLLNSSQEEVIIKLVEELKQKLIYKKRHDLTLQIINNSSYGV